MSVLKIKDASGNWQDIPTIKGSDATINGLNTLNIVGGTNIDIDQEGTTLTINSTGSSGEWGTITGDISDQTDLYTILSQKANKEELGAVKLIGTEENPIILNNLDKGFYILDGDAKYSVNEEYNAEWFINEPIYVLVHEEYYGGTHKTVLLRSKYNNDFPNKILFMETIYDYPNDDGEYYDDLKVLTEADIGEIEGITEQDVYNILDQAVSDNYLLSSDNVKTINNQSIVGSGNIEIESGSSEWGSITGTLSNQSDLQNALDGKANVNDIPTKTSDLNNDSGFITSSYHDSTKVDKVSGKGLSTNDYTTTEKNKLAGLSNYNDTEVRNLISAKYTKPSSGIPKTDLTSAVQTSLEKADSALQSETDPVFSASAASGITSTDITNWNNKSTFSGNYNDLSNKPTIPTKTSDLTNDSDFVNKSELAAIKLTGTRENPIILNNLNKGFYIIDGDVLYSINDQDQDGAHYDWFNNESVYVLVHKEYYDGSHKTILLRSRYNDDFPDRVLYLEIVSDFPNDDGEYYEDVKVITENDLSNLDRLIDHAVYNILDQAVSDNYLLSSDNVKTINNQSIVGSGNIEIESGVPNVVIRPYLSGYRYDEGMIVIKDGVLYQAMRDIPYDEEFNPDHWSDIVPSLSDIVSHLCYEIDNLDAPIYESRFYRGDNETSEFGFTYSYGTFTGKVPNVSVFYVADINNDECELVLVNTKITFNNNGIYIGVELDEPLSENEVLCIAVTFIEERGEPI